MLPYAPAPCCWPRSGQPIVLTSGNVSDEPIAYLDEEALGRLGGIADWFLTHDRRSTCGPTTRWCAPSVGELPLRRSRGFAPQPLAALAVPRHVLACGAELKHTFCLAKGGHAFLSHTSATSRTTRPTGPSPRGRALPAPVRGRAGGGRPRPAPEYLSTKYALELEGRAGGRAAPPRPRGRLPGRQRRARAGHRGRLRRPRLRHRRDHLGRELLVADLEGFRRAGHLEVVPMPGGPAAIREPWRMAAAWLDAAFAARSPNGWTWSGATGPLGAVVALARSGTASRRPRAPAGCSTRSRRSSASGTRSTTRARPRWSWSSWPTRPRQVPTGRASSAPTPTAALRLGGTDLVRAVVEEVTAGVAPWLVAARFHNGLAAATVAACQHLRDTTGLGTVALSGGVPEHAPPGADGHRPGAAGLPGPGPPRVPPNDAGISLGQAAVAGARARPA